jgi:peptidoglycan/LPS O-acetylase OafA/YrhL
MNDVSRDFPLDTEEEPRVRYDALDSLRGIAALAVALHHLQFASHIYFWPITRNAYLFVEFFFVLSGFVIAHAYESRLDAGVDRARFMIKRFGRVWPLHVVMLACFVAAETALYLASEYVHLPLPRAPFSEDRTLIGIPLNFLMLHGLVPFSGAEWNGPSWSVSVELAAYLLFAITSVVPNGRWRLLLQASLMITALILLCTVAKVTGLERCVFSFFLGTFVWRGRHIKIRGVGTFAEAFIVAVALLILQFNEARVQLILAPIVFAAVILILAGQRGAISTALRTPFAIRLGQTSYSIYMVHFFIAFALTNAIKMAGKLAHESWTLPGTDLALIGNNALLMDAITIAYLGMVIMIAGFTYKHIERPGMEWFGRQASKLGRTDMSRALPAVVRIDA